MSHPKLVSVNIRNIAVGGHGVGEVVEQSDGNTDLLGITAFVPYTVRKELVNASIVERKDRHIKTELVEVKNASSERVCPSCQVYSQCGGCELQHMTYGEQLSAKFEMIRGALMAGRVGSDALMCLRPIVPSEPYGYRRRIVLHVDSVGRVGFYQKSSRSVVKITNCVVAVSSINQSLENIQEFGRVVVGKISSIILEADDDGVVAVLKAPYDLTKRDIEMIKAQARDYFKSVVIMVGDTEIDGYGRKILDLSFNGLSFNGRSLGGLSKLNYQIPASYFSQVNWGVNQSLVERVVEFVKPKKNMSIADLYAGAGNFALMLASYGADVLAVECSDKLVTSGRQSAHKLKFDNVIFEKQSVEKFLKNLDKKNLGKNQEFDVVIADPPRCGLGSLLSELPKCKRLLLVSCHLPSFVRDLRGLIEQKWNVISIEPFDMFAQTSYVEVLSVFERKE